jgi:hypothetical protein
MNCMFTSVKSNGGGVYKSYNNGMSWQDMSNGLPFLSELNSIGIFNNKIYAATSGGIYVKDIDEIITGINIGNNNHSSYKLHQNYPNPFNPITKIKFSLPRPSKGGEQSVRLVIYNVLGKEITVLLNQQLPAGSYEVEWNASNVSSGIYYYRIETEEFTETKKMILVK